MYLQRVATKNNGQLTDISYHPVFGKPTAIKRNTDETKFVYYDNGLVKLKTTQFAQMAFEYDQKTQKVSSVKSIFTDNKGKKTGERSTQFKYDDKGNMNYAQNSDGQKIKLTYDDQGRIATVTDQAKKIVKIEYEKQLGKPSIVTRPGVGSIRVEYKADGTIQKVDSPEGPTVAVQVASTFNNLLDIIAPATSELNL